MAGIKFLLDEHIPKAVAKGLRSRGIEALTCADADRLMATDADHLHFAFLESYVMVTADNDFLTLHSAGTTHAGIAFAARPLTIGQFINGLLLIHGVLQAEDMADHIEFL